MSVTAHDIAGRLGLRRYPRSWRGDCPACAYPRSLSVREGPRLFCANGCNHDALNDAMTRVMGGSWSPPERPGAEHDAAVRARKQDAALRLWRGSEPAPGTVVERYLRGRGLPDLAGSAALRFRGDCHHPEGGRLPAMVALVTNAVDQPVAVHRTYLRADGSGKATVEPPKATLGPCWGSAIRLDPVAEELAIGEGVESSASAGRLLGLPAWAAISAGNLAKGLMLPSEVTAVVIAADSDRAGREAAQAAADRWRREGRRVRIAVPDRAGSDFNDLIRVRTHA